MQYTGDEVFDRIEVLCEQGEAYIERGKYRSALQKFWKAFELLPEPKTQYPSGTWLLTAIGDLNFQLQNFDFGILSRACPVFRMLHRNYSSRINVALSLSG